MSLRDPRTGKNGRHAMTGLFRRFVFGRLGGHDDVNDADRPERDPAMRWIVGGRAVAGQAACASRMGRLETEFPAGDEDLPAPTDLSGQWIDRGHARHPPRAIVLDMDSMAIRPTHGDQEGAAWNGHFACTCCHPLFVFNRFGDPAVRRSATVFERYRERDLRRCCRGDAAFAAPDIHEFPETEGDRYTIGLKADAILRQSIACLPTRPVGRPPDHMIRTHAGFSHRAGSWDKKRLIVARVERHPGERVPRVGFIVTRPSRPAGRVVAFRNRRGTAGQHIEEGRNAIVRTRLSCRRFRNTAVRLRLHTLACNPGNLMRTPALPEAVRRWSPTGVKEKPIRIGAGIVTHGRYVTFRLSCRPARTTGEVCPG